MIYTDILHAYGRLYIQLITILPYAICRITIHDRKSYVTFCYHVTWSLTRNWGAAYSGLSLRCDSEDACTAFASMIE